MASKQQLLNRITELEEENDSLLEKLDAISDLLEEDEEEGPEEQESE